MATANSEALYFPPLDQCFSGAQSLIPWTTARGALQDFSSASRNNTLESFFKDKQTQEILRSQLKPFPRPSPQTKSEFDNRTAPIHVSQSANGDYDLQQLKDDALWLSKEFNVDEVSALRCTIVEWQQRPADSILGKIKSENGGQLMKQSMFGKTTMRFGASTNGAAQAGPDFGDAELRRQRLLTVVLDEISAARACTAILVPLAAHNAEDETSEALSGGKWVDEVAKQVLHEVSSDRSMLSTYMQQMRDFTRQLEGAPQWLDVFKDRPSLATTYLDHILQDMVSILRSLLTLVFAMDGVPSKTDVQQWFALVGDNLFYSNVLSVSPVQELYVPVLQILVSIISAAILKPVQAIEDVKQRYLAWQEQTTPSDPTAVHDEDKPYTMDKECISKVTDIIHAAAQQENRIAALSIYVWASVAMVFRDLVKYQLHEGDDSEDEHGTRARSSRAPPGSTWIESLWETVQIPAALFESNHEDSAQYLAATAMDVMQMYSMIANLSINASSTFAADSDVAFALIVRLSMFYVVQSSLSVVQYGPEVLESILALCEPETPTPSQVKSTLPFLERAVAGNEQLRNLVLNQALSRFPYELSPALLLLTPLARLEPDSEGELPSVTDVLDNLQTFMLMTPEDFTDYGLENEEEGRNEILLTHDYPIFSSRQTLGYWQRQQSQEDSRALVLGDGSSSNYIATIPANTLGFVLNERRPWVMRLSHNYSGLEYLGGLLSTLLPHAEIVATDGTGYIDKQVASQIISLINALLSAAKDRDADAKDAHTYVLGRFGAALREGIDIVSVIAEITESELMAHSDRGTHEDSPALLVSCINFFNQLAVHSSERTWSWLSRSSLLGNSGLGVSALVAVTAGAEVPVGKFPFLSACVQLYRTLLDDAISGIIQRKPKVETAAVGRRRFDSPMETAEQTPERTVAKVLAEFTKLARSVLLGLGDWQFEVLEEKSTIVTSLCDTFQMLLIASYGIGGGKKEGERLNEVLMPAATTLTLSEFILAPLDAVLAQGSAVNDDTLTSGQQNMIVHQTEAVFGYLLTVIRTLKLRSGTAGSLPTQLVKLMPTLTSLYASSALYKVPVAELLAVILTPASNEYEELPPILAQLSPENAKDFLGLLSQLDRPLNDQITEYSIWSFLAAALSGSQQFFAMYLLTGSLPKDRYKVGGDAKKHKTLLGHALEQLAGIQNLGYQRAIPMLQFVVKAQQVWIWATNEIAKSDFVKSALSWLETLRPAGANQTQTAVNLLTGELRMASLVCDILAVNLHTSLEVGDKTLLKLVAPKLNFLGEHAAKVDAYNLSLHRNFTLNLPKSVSCEPADFARTAANPAPLGEDHVYDVELAGVILKGHRSWAGFREEFLRSNSNLSLVEAQTDLLKSWKSLATTLADAVDSEQVLQPALAKAAMRAMQENTEANLETPFAAQLLQTRADLAFVLLSRLSAAKAQAAQLKTLLPLAWSLVRTSPVNYTNSSLAEDLRYYTTLLQLLYLALLPHITAAAPTSSDKDASANFTLMIGPTLLDILTHTIAPAFRALCTNLHTSPDLVQPTDFTLLTALLRALLSVHNLTPLHPRIATAIADTNLSRSALALYTWSTTLSREDPIYAPLALNFLTTLSAVPAIAQHLAVESVLATLSSAPLSDAFRKTPGRGPFDEPIRCFEVWSHGFLPLCVDLLSAVGPPIAAEVAAFLNSFPAQLRRAETALVNVRPSARNPRAGAVTLSLVSEARDLLLIASAVKSARDLGAAEGLVAGAVPLLEMDVEGVKAEVGALARSERSLRDRIVGLSAREEDMGVEGLADEVGRMIKGFVEE